MTSKIVVNNIEADSGINTVTFNSNIQGDLIGNVTGNVTGAVNSSGIATFSNGIIVAAGSTAAPSISPTGDSNTGIFFPSADTIAFGEGGVEAARIDSGGRLGIGTVPKTWTSGYNVLQVGSASLVGQPEQDGQTTNWSNNAYFDTNDNRWEYGFADQASQITQSDGLIIFKTASTGTANAALSWTESARFNTSGNLAFPSGQGIDFSATTNSLGTTSSELLSDYEEGTWTPIASASAGTITSYTSSGRYIKIGRIVTLHFAINISNQGTASGAYLLWSGAPYVAANTFTAVGTCREQNVNGFLSTAQINGNGSSGSILRYDNNGVIVNGNFSCTIVYEAA